MRLPRYWKEKIFDMEKRAELTEKMLVEVKRSHDKVIEELERSGYPNHDIHDPETYLHSLNVREAEKAYKKVVKGKTF